MRRITMKQFSQKITATLSAILIALIKITATAGAILLAFGLIGINADQAIAQGKARKGAKVRSIMSPQHAASVLSTGKRNNQTGATSFSSTSKETTMVSLGRENSIEMLQAGNSAKVKSHAKRGLHLEDISLGVQVPRQTAVSNGSATLQNSEKVRSQAERQNAAGTEAFTIDIGTSENIRLRTERSRRMKTYENVSDHDIAAAIRARSRKRTRQ